MVIGKDYRKRIYYFGSEHLPTLNMVKYVEPAQLATWLQQDPSKYLIIDVRDDDFEVMTRDDFVIYFSW